MLHIIFSSIDLFCLYKKHILFSQCRSRDVTLESCFFEISSYSRAYVRIIYERQKANPFGNIRHLPCPLKRVQLRVEPYGFWRGGAGWKISQWQEFIFPTDQQGIFCLCLGGCRNFFFSNSPNPPPPPLKSQMVRPEGTEPGQDASSILP